MRDNVLATFGNQVVTSMPPRLFILTLGPVQANTRYPENFASNSQPLSNGMEMQGFASMGRSCSKEGASEVCDISYRVEELCLRTNTS